MNMMLRSWARLRQGARLPANAPEVGEPLIIIKCYSKAPPDGLERSLAAGNREERTREDINTLWRLAAQKDSRIEPIPCGERQWLEDDVSAIIEIARREGEAITIM